MQWWQDSLEAARAAPDQGDTPALRALSDAMARRALPIEPMLALIEAHRADFYSDAPPTIGDLEGALGETQSSLFQLAALVLGGSGPETADAAGHAGVAYGLARQLSRFAADRADGRMTIPDDVLAEQGITAADVFAATPELEPQGAIARLTQIAEDHLRQARGHLRRVPPSLVPAFLPLAVVEPLLTRIAGLGIDILVTGTSLSDLDTLLRIGWAWIRRRP
jgi:phytoene synthase